AGDRGDRRDLRRAGRRGLRGLFDRCDGARTRGACRVGSGAAGGRGIWCWLARADRGRSDARPRLRMGRSVPHRGRRRHRDGAPAGAQLSRAAARHRRLIVIIVVEGASAAGKTTWCRTHGGSHALLEALPDPASVPTELEAAARFWVDRNVARWQDALEREARNGLVVVDTDPFKLHYVWSLWRTG